MWVLLHEDVGTLAGAVVGLVALGSNDPVPAELLEVHGQGVATAADLGRGLVAVQADHATVTLVRASLDPDFNERQLATQSEHGIGLELEKWCEWEAEE